MAEQDGPKMIMTPPFRVAFPSLFEVNEYDGKYGLDAIFEEITPAVKEFFTKLRAEEKRVMLEKWPKGQPPAYKKLAIKSGNDKAHLAGYEGNMFISPKSNRKPGVVDESNEEMLDHDAIYGGCYARALVTLYAYEPRDKVTGKVVSRGVTVGLQHVQKMGDGDRFTGASGDASEYFEPVDSGNADNYDADAFDDVDSVDEW